MQTGGFDLGAILAMLRRRLWLALTLFGVVSTATVSLLVFLPNVYTATAVVLVQGQQIPEEFVRSTVRIPVQNRLYTIHQEVLSRSRLAQLIGNFSLYQDLVRRRPLDEVIGVVRQAITIDVKEDSRDGAVAFGVSFSGTDARKTMEVANTLASFYVEENLKIRERQAAGTSEFLQSELQETKRKLEEREQLVKQYKERSLGQLPEQLDANLRTLELLQTQLQSSAENLARTQDRRNALAQQILQNEGALASTATAMTPDTLAFRLHTLRRQLAELQTRFSDKYPDVQQTKREIAVLEQKLQGQPQETPAGGPIPLSPVQLQLRELDTEIRLLNTERAKTQQEIAKYQQRVEHTPKREQELLVLTRDYNSTRELYASLLKRQEEANLAGSMERHQKGEQFRILDPATYPEEPMGPQRLKLLVVGLLLSLGVAAGGVILWEKFLDTSFHSVEELEMVTSTAVLASIPKIVTAQGRRDRRRQQWLRVAAFAVSLLLVAAVVRQVAVKNEQLVMKLTKPAGTLP